MKEEVEHIPLGLYIGVNVRNPKFKSATWLPLQALTHLSNQFSTIQKQILNWNERLVNEGKRIIIQHVLPPSVNLEYGGGGHDDAALLCSLMADERDNQIKQISKIKIKGQIKRYYSYSAKKDEKFKLNTKT